MKLNFLQTNNANKVAPQENDFLGGNSPMDFYAIVIKSCERGRTVTTETDLTLPIIYNSITTNHLPRNDEINRFQTQKL